MKMNTKIFSSMYPNRLLISSLLIGVSMFLSANLTAQSAWTYISPKPNSKYINPENNISFRNGERLDINSISKSSISVTGSISGEIKGKLRLSSDNRTLIFLPNSPFKYGEKIYVIVPDGISTLNGIMIKGTETVFTIKQGEANTDNTTPTPFSSEYKVTNNDINEGNFSSNGLIHYGEASLPNNYPVPEILTFNNPSPELCFYSTNPKTDRYGHYAVIMDNYGTPVFFREWPSKTALFMVVPNNQLVHKNRDASAQDKASFLVLNDKYEIQDTLQVRNGYKTNTHDMVMRKNGNHLLIIYDSQLVGMDTVVPGGDPDATVKGFVLQELDPDHNVIFQWRSWDHFEITDATHVDLTSSTIDYVHVNAIDTTLDGNILICSRHLDEITKIDRNTGEIIWRFGPQSKNNMFTFTNDTVGFSYPHDIQQLSNGNLTLFDNGNFNDPQQSRGLEYEIDEENLSATLVWDYVNDPPIYAPTTGSTRRLNNGNTIIGWGGNHPLVSTEVTEDGTKAWEFKLDSTVSYRYLKYDWETSVFETNVDSIDYGYYNGYEPWPVIFTITNNVDYDITITSASNHKDVFYLETSLPINIPAGESKNLIINFFPEGTEDDFNDVLTLNYDGYYSDTLNQRISRQIHLTGTTIDHSYIGNNNETNIRVYPNPTTEFVRVTSSDKLINSISVYSLTGAKIFEVNNINSINYILSLSNCKPGIYFADINVADVAQNIKAKIVVK